MKKQLARLTPLLAICALFGIWEIVCVAFKIDSFILPRPSAIFRSLIENRGPIAEHSWQTLWTTIAGFAIAIGVGILLGCVVGVSASIYRTLYPLLVGFNSIPKAAFVPILVVWFGTGTKPAIITAFLLSFFPIVANVATGLATLEPELEDVLRALGASRTEILMKVGLPRSMPLFFASLKIAVTMAFVGTVVAEISASDKGIGYLMMSASSSMKTDLMFAGMIMISVMAMAMYEFFAWMEKRVTGWAYRGEHAHT
ncbi:MAG: transport system permease protein TauT family [Herbaspirillum sp.]|jgi:NitT/TauT family transport system permease protein|nr:transport system permease protein TauT family [Herbaspirillum sp.]